MRITKLLYVFSFIFILFFTLCPTGFAQKKSSIKKIQKGLATWYGNHFHGQKTANNEVYNKNRMTAAHLSLPFGTKVKVTNKQTKKSVIVRINDRGPFGHKKRIIDLSEAAARKIDVYAEGAAEVIVEIIPPGSARVKFKAKKAKAIAKAKAPVKAAKAKAIAKAKTPVQKQALAQAKPKVPQFMAKANPFLRPANALLMAQITESQDSRQPLALREEELTGYWRHQVITDQEMSRSQAEENRFRYKETSLAGLVELRSGAS